MKNPEWAPQSSQSEVTNRQRLKELFESSPLGDELQHNLPLFMARQEMMRVLFFKELYERIINVHGVIMEFGCKWGTNLATFTALRGIYEPYNHNRKCIGFDTFAGLKGISKSDGKSQFIKDGAYATSGDYDRYLQDVLSCLENECPLPHIRKSQVIKGDVRETVPNYLAENPQTIIALAYFDMDIYEPTRVALEAIMPYVTKGTIIGFDECNWKEMPGPTMALKEVLGTTKYRICRSPLQPIPGFVVIE